MWIIKHKIFPISAFFVAVIVIAGFICIPDTDAQNPAQQKLMARRAAKVDALRNLAEQVYGTQITSSTNVRDFVTQSDTIRARLDALIQGAKEVDYVELPDGTAEVTVEITLGRVQDILGRRLMYDYQTFSATGYGAPSGPYVPRPNTPSGSSGPTGEIGPAW